MADYYLGMSLEKMDDLFGVTELVEKKVMNDAVDSRNPSVSEGAAQKQAVDKVESV